MGTSLNFVRRGSVHYAESVDDFAAGPFRSQNIVDTRMAFVAASDAAPAELSFSASWTLGVYVCLAEPVRDESTFTSAVRHLLGTTGVRIVWLENPNARPERWRFSALRLMDLDATGGTIAAPAILSAGSLALAIPTGVRVTLEATGFSLPATGIRLLAGHGRASLPVITGPLRITLASGSTGAFTFPLRLSGADLETLDVGCRIYYPGQRLGHSDLLAGVRYRIFDPAAATLSLDALVDPLAPTVFDRTNFQFAANHVPIPSFFRTGVGAPLSLQPLAGSRLVLSPRNTGVEASPRDPLVLVPDGPFGFTAPTLLCGIFGSEFIDTPQATQLLFRAGSPAFTAGFRAHAPSADGGPPPALSSAATTAWAQVTTVGGRLFYSSVPEDAGFYENKPGTNLLPYYPARAAFLPATAEAQPDEAYPLLPYAGFTEKHSAIAQQLELSVLAPNRRELVRLINRGGPLPNQEFEAEAVPGTIQTITPQGMLAEFSSDGASWTRLTLGRSDAGPLAFQNVTEPLRSALLTKQQFLVISDPEKIADIFRADADAARTETDVRIAGWDIDLRPSNWAAFGTVLIIKNDDRPLQDLAGDVHHWTQGAHFNRSPERTSERLIALLEAARAAATLTASGQPTHDAAGNALLDEVTGKPRQAAKPDFAYFAETVAADPDWNGVLFLNAKLSPGGLPSDLDGFAAGIDKTRFFAHHLGINQTPVAEQLQDALQMTEPSSFFGLIDYAEPPARTPRAGDFDFSVKKLGVLFRNSQVTNFSCQVALTINRFLGAPVAPGRNVLTLDGRYEEHGGGNALALTQQGPAELPLQDVVLAQANIERTHFTTRLPAAGAVANIEARFNLWGALQFKELSVPDEKTTFDLFSYHRLKYSQLAVRMVFPADEPERVTFSLDTADTTVEAGEARAGSLANHFPMKLKSFSSSFTSGKPPNKLGYATIGLPVKRHPLTDTWFGLTYDLNLGTLGELGGNVGITAQLALLWSPDASENRILAGLKIPGLTGSGAGFSLMGLLKMKMHSLDLVHTGGAYQLLLNGITLNLFGKSLPPGASFDFFVFGDPSPNASPDSVGWYGAYKKTP